MTSVKFAKPFSGIIICDPILL